MELYAVNLKYKEKKSTHSTYLPMNETVSQDDIGGGDKG